MGAAVNQEGANQQTVQASYGEALPAEPIAQEPVRSAWNVTRVDLAVKPAQAISADPFSDPFGDRKVSQTAGSTLELQPTDAEAGIEKPAPRAMAAPRIMRAPRTDAARPIPTEDVATEGGQPTIEYVQAEGRPGDEIPTPESDSELLRPRTSVPCDRIYNDRNCCEVDNNCTAFRNQLFADSIRNISLDITPRFMPDLEAEQDEETRIDRLRLLEIRPWHGRRGELLATGRMSNFLNGKVIIVDESGNEVARLSVEQLGEDETCYLGAWWRLPTECTIGGTRDVTRAWIPSTFAWQASALCHKPLYFEEVQLERYGHTAGPFRQPILSGAHFFLNIATLPYHMAYQPPHECQYALGYYRPGSCAPWMIPPIPLSLRGAIAETGAIVGGIYLFP